MNVVRRKTKPSRVFVAREQGTDFVLTSINTCQSRVVTAADLADMYEEADADQKNAAMVALGVSAKAEEAEQKAAPAPANKKKKAPANKSKAPAKKKAAVKKTAKKKAAKKVSKRKAKK